MDNDKVHVYETRYKLGDVNKEVGAGYRVVRTLQGGTLMRTYADGKTEKNEIKEGRVVLGQTPKPGSPHYTNTNVGKTEIVQYIVLLKEVNQGAGTKK